jgi:hypothetical protein
MGDETTNYFAESANEAQRATPQRLRAMFTTQGVAGYGTGDGAGVICPFCPPEEDASYIHITQRLRLVGNDNYDTAGEYGLHVHGDVVAVEFWSETCPHRWALAFGFHKGATFVRVIRLADSDDEE